jgi:hypothetical protein
MGLTFVAKASAKGGVDGGKAAPGKAAGVTAPTMATALTVKALTLDVASRDALYLQAPAPMLALAVPSGAVEPVF